MFGLICDDVNIVASTTTAKALELTAKLRPLVQSIKTLSTDASGMAVDLQNMVLANQTIFELIQLNSEVKGASLQINYNPAQPLTIPRKQTAQYYNYQQNNTKTKRQKDNEAAVEIVRKFNAGEITLNDITDEQRLILGKYTGNGGNLLDVETGKRGSDYEYYTPKPIAENIWEVLTSMGFSGGKVLDPCAGVGIFGATAPLSAAIDAVELDKTSGTINKLINQSDSYNVQISNFEQIAANTPDGTYDAVVANVPFGNNTKRGRNKKDDPKYQNLSLEAYFILRSLEKLKGGGIAAFLVPDRCVTGKGAKETQLRQSASLYAEFMGAFRLPNVVFGAANADTITCVMFFKKFTDEALAKVDDLYATENEVLHDANVLWDSFIDGKYFETAEGKKRVLGDEFIPKDPNDKYERDQLTSSEDILTIARKMLFHKLPKSRIDWGLLEESEGLPIQYNDGDVITQNGLTLQLKDKQWVTLNTSDRDAEAWELVKKVADPYSAFINKVSFDDAMRAIGFMQYMSKAAEVPAWLSGFNYSTKALKKEDKELVYMPVLIGKCIEQILESEGVDGGTNYQEKYELLSKAMKKYAVNANRVKSIDGIARQAINIYRLHYTKAKGFSAIWSGQIKSDIKIDLTPDASFEGLIYKNKSPWVTLEELKSIYGQDFDPYQSDDWCISFDGTKVCRADDYYLGNFGQFLANISQAIDSAPNDTIKDKLLAQKNVAYSRVTKVDAAKIEFNLFSPYVTVEEKVEFLKRFVHESARVIEGADGKPEIKFNIPKSETDSNPRLKYMNRLASYLKSGRVSLQGIEIFGITDAQKLKDLRDLINKTNEQFNAYVRSNSRITSRLERTANDPTKMRFIQKEDTADLVVQGMNKNLVLHPYQRAYVRKQSREFGGINGFDVGLGKTFTALASVQYVQSIGVKQRTMFVVPNSVLSNWHKEAKHAYQSIEDCLFVGLRMGSDGQMTSDSKYYDDDLLSIIANKPSKIFLTFEAFERLKLKAETISEFESFMRTVDASFAETQSKKDEEATQGRLSDLTEILENKSGAAPFLEDLGIDSIVIDEAHAFKNSSQVADFDGGKFLSVSDASKRGLDAQAKCWYIRGLTEKKDGVLLLTATPITNSPLEIYSMMSLAVGHERVNALSLGINGADQFMNAVCLMEDEEEETIDGRITNQRVFKGLTNSVMLRNLIGDIVTVKTADQVGQEIIVPDEENQSINVHLTEEIKEKLNTYKNAYRFALGLVTKRNLHGDEQAYAEVKNRFKEDDKVIAHPFNLINKMNLLIADPDLDERYTKYVFLEDQSDILQKVVAEWNSKKPIDEVGKLSAHTLDEDFTEVIKKNKLTGNDISTFKVSVRAWNDDKFVYIDSTTWQLQEKFEELAEKHGLDLDCTMSPKLAALFDNLKKENAHVRGVDSQGNKAPYAKQIIFCDMLGMHNKIRILLSKKLGISPSQVAIVTGQRNNDPSSILNIQNNFNAYGDDNYRIIIANEKAEVGINLQIGTQAIHHLTIGWTPDSLTQRNGRGVRQGNRTDYVNVYYYDANGTFDTAKRTLVNSKADWIDNLMDSQGSNKVEIVGGMSIEQMRALIDHMGDDSLEAMQIEIAKAEKQRAIEENVTRQLVSIDTVIKQSRFLKEYDKSTKYLAKFLYELFLINDSIKGLNKKIDNPKSSLRTVSIAKRQLISEQAKYEKLLEILSKSIHVSDSYGNPIASDVYLKAVLEEKIKSSDYWKLQWFFENNYLGSIGQCIVNIDDDAPLLNEWKFEIESSKGLIVEATRQFKERALVEGSISGDFIDEIAAGNGKVSSGGLAYTPECFLVINGDPEQGFYELSNATWNKGLLERKKVVLDIVSYKIDEPQYTLAYPNSPLHERCCIYAAEYEESIVGQDVGELVNAFSEKNSFVQAYRTTEVLTAYKYFGHFLTSPYFPFIVKNIEGADLTEIEKHIAQQQSKAIKCGESHFYTNIDVTKQQDQDEISVYADYAKAHGLTFKVEGKFSYIFNVYATRTLSALSEEITEIMTSAETSQGLIKDVAAYIRGIFYYISDLPEDNKALKEYLPFGLKRYFERKLMELVRKEEAEGEGDSEAKEVFVEAEDLNVIPETAIIRVTPNAGFNTKPYASKFRSYSDEIQNHVKYEKPSTWRGTTASAFFHKFGSKKWEIPYGAWKLFAERDPILVNNCTIEVILGGVQ